MCQAKKGSHLHRGMKAHTGANVQPDIVHWRGSDMPNLNDLTQAFEMLRVEQVDAFCYAFSRGLGIRQEVNDPHWDIVMQPGKVNQFSNDLLGCIPRRYIDRSV